MKQIEHTPTEHLVRMRIERFQLGLPKIVEGILAEIPRKSLRELVRRVAMEPNEIAFKRKVRPKPEVIYTLDLLGRALGLEGERLDELLKMTVAFVEAGDLHDDAVDGDYKEGHLHHLMAVSSTLHFVATRCALRLGPEVADAWLESMYELPHSLLLEKDGDSSLSTYMEAVQSQAELFGALGRVAALAAGASEEDQRRAIELTKLFYAYLQYPQDLKEAPREVGEEGTEGSSLAANIMRHMNVQQMAVLFAQVHTQMQKALDGLPDNRSATHLRELITAMRPA